MVPLSILIRLLQELRGTCGSVCLGLFTVGHTVFLSNWFVLLLNQELPQMISGQLYLKRQLIFSILTV